uniref:Kinesin motor domain-containing protein n=1 Tax=Oryza meridionalis TaxID=40149 RepID=A0A0E0CIB4_9ORYZ
MSSSNNAAAAAASPDPSRRREDVVGWLLALFPDLPLPPPPEATDEDLRAALATGRLLCALLRRLCPGALLDDASTDNVGRFRAAVERMGVAKFSASDLERGQMTAVVNCILALKDRFGSRGGDDHRNPGFLTRCDSEGGRKRVESKLQRMLTSPIMSEPSSPVLGSDPYSPSQVFQLKQGGYADQLGGKYSDLLKSTSLDNAPTQSLLGVFNSILDESIERKNGQIPYRIACLLRKVILEIERRISTQAGHIRNQNNLIKAREEKYQSRIRVLEVLAGGMEKDKFGDKGQLAVEDMERLMKYQDDVVRLMKENEDLVRLLREKEDMVRLLKEKEDMEKEDIIRLMKEKEDMVYLEKGEVEARKQMTDDIKDKLIKEKDDIVFRLTKEKEEIIKLTKEKEEIIKEKDDIVVRLTKEKEEIIKLLEEKEDIISLMKQKEDMFMSIKEKENKAELKKIADEDAARSIKDKAEIMRLMKEKEDGNNTILKLKKELETLRSSYEESCRLLESKKEDVARLLTDKENNDSIISELKKELEETKRLHEAHSQQLETKAAQVSKELEQRIEEVKLMLDDSTKRRIELEELSETRIQFWKKKEVVINQFVSLQVQNVQDLKLSSVSVRHEILNCQNKWSEELAGLGKSLKVVTNTAEKYHGALAENRKLFNEIQELKGNIRVYCRIRPFRPGEDDKSSSVEYIGDNGELVLSNPTKQGKEGGKNFTFNKVFGPITTQDAVFKDIQPLIRSVLDGYNVCIFAYGQTGSGKTYTMMGPEKATEKEWGVNYRALNDLFNISHDRRDTITYELGVQMIEIYNEQIRDLLGSGIQNTIQPNGLAVPDATMCPVTSTSHVIELMQTGHDNRAMSATALNERSSRSHSVVTIHVRGQDLKTGNTLRGALHLVDLAGSERVDRSAVTGDRLKEAQHINKSLAALGDVIFSLSQKNTHVPYRNSKLTQVLQTSLGGHAKTLMFVQVNPDVSSYTETLSTLKFAERVSGVELGVARSNKEGKEGKDVKELMDQLSLLKDTISKKDEEIDRLQLLNSSTRLKPTRQADSVLKHSSSSPGITSLGKGTSVGSGAASDLDNFSDTSDRQSEAGSMLSVDPEISGLADVDSDGRLSDASDGISMGAEADSSVSNVADQEQEKTSNTAAKERLTRAVNRVQKLTLPKAGQSSSLRPKPRDPAPARSSAATGVRKSSTSQATPPLARNNSTLKRGP